MIRYFFLLRKTESGRQNQNSLPFLFMGKILSLLKRIKISKGEIKWKENILSTGFKSVLYNIKQKKAIADEIFRKQPQLLFEVLGLNHLGVPMDRIEHVLNLLLIFYDYYYDRG